MTRHKTTQDDERERAEPADEAPSRGRAGAAGRGRGGAEERAPREAELEAELAETKDRLLRTLAETENLRRRTAREVEDAHKYAITGFARDLLEVADNLSRALACGAAAGARARSSSCRTWPTASR